MESQPQTQVKQVEPKRSNRRLSVRRIPKGSTKVACRKGSFGLGHNIGIGILDLSETGIRLVVKEALQEKQEVEVILTAQGSVREFKHVGRVVWCVPAVDGSFCIGVEFEKRINYVGLQDLSRLPGS